MLARGPRRGAHRPSDLAARVTGSVIDDEDLYDREVLRSSDRPPRDGTTAKMVVNSDKAVMCYPILGGVPDMDILDLVCLVVPCAACGGTTEISARVVRGSEKMWTKAAPYKIRGTVPRFTIRV
jgi:hypothetical protein